MLSRRAALTALSSAGAALFLGAPALADHTYAAAKRSFDRYYPRILSGVDMMREVRAIVKGGPGSVADIVDGKLFGVKLRRALSIYATSFSDNYLGQRSRELLSCVKRFYAEIEQVKEAGGKEDMVEHYNGAVEALFVYFETARLDRAILKDLYL